MINEPYRLHGNCCGTDRCEERGCKVHLPAVGDLLALNGSLYQENHGHEGKLCDAIVIWMSEGVAAGLKAAVVELKSGRVQVEAADQLQAGARLLEVLLDSSRPKFSVFLAKGKGITAMNYKVLRNRKVRFQGSCYPIRLVPCGSSIDF
jgi:hypothetical protein